MRGFRSRRFLASLAGILVVVALALNVTGIVRYPGGPLREPGSTGLLWTDGWPADWGSSEIGAGSAAGIAAGEHLLTGVGLRNPGPWTVTVERVTLLEAAGLELISARTARDGALSGMPGLMRASDPATAALIADFDPLPQPLDTTGDLASSRLVVAVTAAQPGSHAFKDLAVDYRIGPFSFRTTYHLALRICFGPTPAGQVCEWDLPRD